MNVGAGPRARPRGAVARISRRNRRLPASHMRKLSGQLPGLDLIYIYVEMRTTGGHGDPGTRPYPPYSHQAPVHPSLSHDDIYCQDPIRESMSKAEKSFARSRRRDAGNTGIVEERRQRDRGRGPLSTSQNQCGEVLGHRPKSIPSRGFRGARLASRQVRNRHRRTQSTLAAKSGEMDRNPQQGDFWAGVLGLLVQPKR